MVLYDKIPQDTVLYDTILKDMILYDKILKDMVLYDKMIILDMVNSMIRNLASAPSDPCQ